MSDGIRLTPKQSNIFIYGWQPNARFRYACCGRRFGKSYLATAEIRRAARLAVERGVSPDDEIWYAGPTFKQAKRVFWPRLKRAIPRSWIKSSNETECYLVMKTGHVIRLVGLDNYDNLRGSGLWFFVGDEWADCPPQAWDEVVRPMLSTAQGHALFIGCVKHDTLVLPRGGMTPIERFSKGSPDKTLDPMSEQLWGLDRAFHAADGFWNNGTVATKRIRSQRGFELEASLPHPVLVMGDDGIPAWKKMRDLAVGDRIAIDRGMEIWGDVDPLNGWAEHVAEWRKRFDGKRGPKPAQINVSGMTEDLAYFLGLWIAEGSCEEKIGRITITCGDNVGDFLTSGDVLGLKFLVRRSDQWAINSYEFLEMMRFIGTPICKAPLKTLPAWVMRGRREWAMAFIAGMWDGDGYCGQNASPRIGYSSASRPLVAGLQLLLTNIGVMSRLTSHNMDPTVYCKVASVQNRLTLSGPDIARFRGSVRLRIPRKQAILEGMDVGTWSRRDGVPNQAELLRTVRNSLRRRDRDRKMPKNCFTAALDHGCDVSYEMLKGFVDTHDSAKHLPEWMALKHNLDCGYYWDEVETIKDSESLTYDFTIPETNSFWSNGFISHNTPKGYNHFYDGWLAGQPDGDPESKSWLYTTLDGGNVPEHEIERAKRELDPRSFRQEYCATFESFGGRVYYAFDRQKSVKRCIYDPARDIHVGMDFNVNPMSATVFQIQDDGEVWQVHEIQIPSSNTFEMCQELKRRYGRENAFKHIFIYPDPAGAQRRTSAQGETDISILRKEGFTVLAMSSHPLVRDRINVVNAMFENAAGERRLFVDPSCKKSIESYERLSFKEGTSDPDKTQTYLSDNSTTIDHLVDSCGYFCFTKFGKSPTRAIHIPFMGR